MTRQHNTTHGTVGENTIETHGHQSLAGISYKLLSFFSCIVLFCLVSVQFSIPFHHTFGSWGIGIWGTFCNLVSSKTGSTFVFSFVGIQGVQKLHLYIFQQPFSCIFEKYRKAEYVQRHVWCASSMYSRLCMKMLIFLFVRACAMQRILYLSCGIPFPV